MRVNTIPAGRWMDTIVDEFVYGAYGEAHSDFYFIRDVPCYSTDTLQALEVVKFLLSHSLENHWIALQKCAESERGEWEWLTYIGPENINCIDTPGVRCMYCGSTMKDGVCLGCGNRAVLIGSMEGWGVALTLSLSICRAALLAMGIELVESNHYDAPLIDAPIMVTFSMLKPIRWR